MPDSQPLKGDCAIDSKVPGTKGRNARPSLWGVAGLCLLLQAGAARADTLGDAIALAYQTNPTLQNQRARLRALNESYVQARTGYRPQASVSVEGDYTEGPSTFQIPLKTASATLSLSQPIYTGGFTTAQVRAAEGEILAGREQLRQVEANVLQAVIQAYVDVRRDVAALAIAEENVKVLKSQLDETQARFDVRQITRTDVAQAQARLAAAQAQLSTTQAQLAISRANYTAVVGQSPGDLDAEPPLPGLPATIGQAFDAAQANNPNIIAADYAEQAAAARVAAAKAENHPTVAVRAQLGYSGSYVSTPALGLRDGVYQSNVTASAVLTQPLFTGGLNASRIRQALEDDNSQRIGIDAARRQTQQQVSQAWNQLLAAKANTTSNEEQVRADQIAYEGTRQEAQVGLRTTLDVLNAEQELRAAQLAVVNAQHDRYVAGTSVLNAMGQLEAKALAPKTPLYDADKAFRKVKHDGAVPWEGLVSGLDSVGAPTIRRHPDAPTPDAPTAPAQAGGQVVQ